LRMPHDPLYPYNPQRPKTQRHKLLVPGGNHFLSYLLYSLLLYFGAESKKPV
jgi:hypothetical protein